MMIPSKALQTFLRAEKGWDSALQDLGLGDTEFDPDEKGSSPFGRKFLDLLSRSGIDFIEYLKNLAAHLDGTSRQNENTKLIPWELTARRVLSSMPEEFVLGLRPHWESMLSHPQFPAREFGMMMLSRLAPSLEEALSKLKIVKGHGNNPDRHLFLIAQGDPEAAEYLSRTFPTATGGLREICETLILWLGPVAVSSLDALESAWRNEKDPVAKAYRLRTIASVASGLSNEKKNEVFSAILAALEHQEWRVHSCCYEALGLLGHRPEDSVDLLARALDTEEPAYDGFPQLSILEALEKFGTAASKHAESVARHLHDEPPEVNDIGEGAVLDVLLAMGPQAKSAESEVRKWLEERRAVGDDYESSVEKLARRLLSSWEKEG